MYLRLIDTEGEELMPLQHVPDRDYKVGDTFAWKTDLRIIDAPARLERRDLMKELRWSVTLTAEIVAQAEKPKRKTAA